jgi:hypothetical protein
MSRGLVAIMKQSSTCHQNKIERKRETYEEKNKK